MSEASETAGSSGPAERALAALARLGWTERTAALAERRDVWWLQDRKAEADEAVAQLGPNPDVLVVVRCPTTSCREAIARVVGRADLMVYRAKIEGTCLDPLERPLPWVVATRIRELPEHIVADDAALLEATHRIRMRMGSMPDEKLPPAPTILWESKLHPDPDLDPPQPLHCRCRHHSDLRNPEAWQVERQRVKGAAAEALRTGKRQSFRWARVCSFCATPLGTAPGAIDCPRCGAVSN